MTEIRTIQMAILKVAKEIHSICVTNDIKYFMLGGTFIGAVRHKGFIPWDDDIDFGMTYDQYIRFIEVAKKLSHPWLVFDFPEYENKEYANLFIKAYDKNTTFIERNKTKDVRGVFVDIFPVVSAHDTKEASLKEIKKSFYVRRLLQCQRYNLYQHRPLLNILTKLVAFWTPRKLLYNLSERQYSLLAFKDKKYYVALDGTKKDVYDFRYFQEEYVLYPFEDTSFYGIKDYDGYLTDVFKDYMKLPPEEKRVPLHLSYFNPDMPFNEYVKSNYV